MTSTAEVAIVLVALVGVVPSVLERVEDLLERDVDDVDQEDRIDDLRRRYLSGELELLEFERRVMIVLDEDQCNLRGTLEDVDGIGPETSAAVAARFATVEQLAEADQADLEDVNGVGVKRARDIIDQVRA